VDGRVLDSYAVLAWMAAEPAAPTVRAWLQRAQRGEVRLYLSVVNAGEVYYRLARAEGGARADAFRSAVRRKAFPWRVESATSARVWEAARIKGTFAMAYADAFAVALAAELGLPVLTGDAEIVAVDGHACLVDALPGKSA